MAGWTVSFDVARASRGEGEPAFLRIARAIVEDVKRGRLRAGDALPGSRTLASALGVHRNTVLAAYRELIAEGWIATEEARGTFVARDVPDVAPRKFSSRAAVAKSVAMRPGFDVPDAQRQDDLLARVRVAISASEKTKIMTLGGGVPDVRLVPSAELARAVRRVLKRRTVEVLSYREPEGPPQLRRALARMLAATRGIAAGEDDVLVTRGSQMAIDLVARTAIAPGDAVAVEALGYRPAWDALRAAGARLVPVPVDARGIDVDALAKLDVRGVYVTPHHQFPTTVTLAPSRRLRILELARARRMFVLEDDYDHEFHYEGRPVLPLASADVHGVVIYVGTLSKVLAPGMRIGFVVAPRSFLERLAAVRCIVDRQGDHLLEHAVAELLEDGEIQRHVRRAKRIYAGRRAMLAELLERELGGVLAFDLPNGGTAIWSKVASSVNVDQWAARATELGLLLQPARQFAFDGKSRPYLRLGFAQHDEREAREAVRRLVAAMPRVSAR